MIPVLRHTVTAEDRTAVTMALASDYLTNGPETEACEALLAEMAGCKYAVLVNSCTFALMAIGMYVEGPLTVPAISFVATATAYGRRVRFLDVQPNGLCPDADVAVSLGGRPIHARIVDAAHGPITHMGTVATCLSFDYAKPVTAGEGGCVLTNLSSLAETVRLFRNQGRTPDGRMVTFGSNGRITEYAAALVRSQLARYQTGVEARRRIAAQYDDAFHGIVEPIPHGPGSARYLYQIRVGNGEAFRTMCAQLGVGTQTHYRPIPLEPYYKEWFGQSSGFPEAERWGAEVVSLPCYASMSEQDTEMVIRAVKEAA